MEATEVRKLAALEDQHWWYSERRAVLRRAISSALVGRTGGGRLTAIDIGAAGGGNTRVLRDMGLFAIPIEYGSDGAEVARDRGLLSVRGDATRLPVADGSIDVVVAFDVLEHIGDDIQALREIRRVLSEGGKAFIAVPADMSLWSAHDESVGHVRRYSRESLASAVETSGLAVESLRSWNVLLRPAIARRRRATTGSDLGETSRVVNQGLRLVVAAERVLPVGHLPGISLMLRATRN
jgi:SAM-dependent methyltransferase